MSADIEPVCANCLARDGLCPSHRSGILPPPLYSNWPIHLMGKTHYDDRQEESPEARKNRERKARKRAKAAARLQAAMGGAFTRSTRAA